MNPPTRLEPILSDVRRRLSERKALVSFDTLLDQAGELADGRDLFCAALRKPGLSIIAEHKRKAPSSGPLSIRTLDETVALYEQGGASAMSVLTEEDHFDGRLADLKRASTSSLPCIRKDFIVDPYMIAEAKVHGASAVLLLANVLNDEEIAAFCALAHDLGLAVLLETHDASELDRALKQDADAIGVNARDLKTFQIDLNEALHLLAGIPSDFIKIAESGVHQQGDAIRCFEAGADAALVGTSLMRAEDPISLLGALTDFSGA